MYIHDLNPVLFSLGSFKIYYYSLAYLFGFLLALFLLIRKREKLGLSKDDCYDLTAWMIIGTIIGARLFEVLFWSPGYYYNHLIEIIAFWKGISGMSYHGGLFGLVIAVWLFSKKRKLAFLELADVIVIPAALALAFGRIGNFINGELVGTVTNFSWCVVFPLVDGCRHPQQLYAAGYRFFIFFGLLGISKIKKKAGVVFFSYLLLEGIGRFAVDFFREDLHYLGLSLGQWFSIAMILIGGYLLMKNCFNPTKKLVQSKYL